MSTLVACLPTHVLLREFPNADFGCGHLFINSPTTVGATVLHAAHPSNRTTNWVVLLSGEHLLIGDACSTHYVRPRVAGAPTRAHRDISEKSWGKLSQCGTQHVFARDTMRHRIKVWGGALAARIRVGKKGLPVLSQIFRQQKSLKIYVRDFVTVSINA